MNSHRKRNNTIYIIIILVITIILYLKNGYSGIILNVTEIKNDGTQQNTNKEKSLFIPKKLEDCFIELKNFLGKDKLEEFKNIQEDKISKYHFKIRMWIRIHRQLEYNSRLVEYFYEMGIFNFDAMSNIIITSFHRYLNNKDIQLEQQIEYYQSYWKEIREKAIKRFDIELGEARFNSYPKYQDVLDVKIPIKYITDKKFVKDKLSSFVGNIFVQVINCFPEDSLANAKVLFPARYDKDNGNIMFSIVNPSAVVQIISIFGIYKSKAELIDFTEKNWGYQLQNTTIKKNQRFKKLRFNPMPLKVKNLPKVLAGPHDYLSTVSKRALLSEKFKNKVAYSGAVKIGNLFIIPESNDMFWTDEEYKWGIPRLDISSKEKYTVIQLAGPHDLPPYLKRANLFDSEENILLTFVKAAKLVERNGASGIDINMGSPTIYNQGGGVALTENQDLAYKIVKNVKNNVNIPVSVKIRLLIKEVKEENGINFVPDIEKTCEFIGKMIEAGADWVVIHTRTKYDTFQFGIAKAKWYYLKDVKNYFKIRNINTPIFGNGDIFSPEDAKVLLSSTGCDGVMIVTKMLGDPSILYRTAEYLKGNLLEEPSIYDKIIVAAKDLYNHLLYTGSTYKESIIISMMLVSYIQDIIVNSYDKLELKTALRTFEKEINNANTERDVLNVLFKVAEGGAKLKEDRNKIGSFISMINNKSMPLEDIWQRITKEYRRLTLPKPYHSKMKKKL